jgi:N-acetyl-beta-hexosaminidase
VTKRAPLHAWRVMTPLRSAGMWGEYIDGSALLNVAWPRAAATAERLWSPPEYTNATEAKTRLARFRCLLEARGIPAGVLDINASSPYTKLQGVGQAGQPPPGPASCYEQ